MRIHATPPLSSSPSRLPVPVSPLGRTVDDMVTLSQIVASGQLYKMAKAEALAFEAQHPPLRDVPFVRLERPYVVVPGWTTRPEKFDALVTRLTEGGRNGGRPFYVQDGRFFADGALTQPLDTVPADARVFVQVFHDRLQPPSETAPQVGRSLDAVRAATGSSKVDVEGYSLGGLAVRKHLDAGGSGVGKVLLLGTPNGGTRFAQLAQRLIRRDIGWAMKLAGLTIADLPAMEWMSAGANPQLAALNASWDRQRAATEGVLLLGSEELPTPSRGLVPLRRGDGLVERQSLTLPDADVRMLEGRPTLQHGFLPSDREVYGERARFFGWATEA